MAKPYDSKPAVWLVRQWRSITVLPCGELLATELPMPLTKAIMLEAADALDAHASRLREICKDLEDDGPVDMTNRSLN